VGVGSVNDNPDSVPIDGLMAEIGMHLDAVHTLERTRTALVLVKATAHIYLDSCEDGIPPVLAATMAHDFWLTELDHMIPKGENA